MQAGFRNPPTRHRTMILRVGVAAVLALLLLTGAALAAEHLTISLTDVDVSEFPEATAVVQVGGDAASDSFDPENLAVLVDGKLQDDVTLMPADTSPVPSTTVLLIDESGSMAGEPMAAAADAAGRFIGSMREVDRVGIFTFDEEFRILQEPTGDREALKAVIPELQPRLETALYDAVLESLSALRDESAESVYLIILSDGGDTASSSELEDVLAQARASSVQIYTVGLLGNEFDSAPLQQLAEATGGRYLEAPNVDALATLYSSLASEIQNQFRLSVTLDEDMQGAGAGQLTVKYLSDDVEAEVSRGFFYPEDTATPTTEAPDEEEGESAVPPAAPPTDSATWVSSFVQWGGSDYIVAIIVFALLLVIGYTLIVVLMPKRDVLAEYSDILENRRDLGPKARESGEEQPRRRLGEALVERLINRDGSEDPLQRRLEAAGWKVRTSEFIVIHLSGLALFVALVLLLGLPLPLVVILALAAAVGPLFYLDYKTRKRREAFESQIPEILLLMANAFRAGQSFEQAMQVVAAEGPEPTRTEFRRILAQQRLGIAPETALRTLADRMQSEVFDWVVMATIIQRQVGGNLAEVYERIAHTLRERVKLQRLVKTLTAEGKLSAVILIALPFLVGFALVLVSFEYLEPLYTTTAGYVLLSLSAAGMAVGVLWIRRIVQLRA